MMLDLPRPSKPCKKRHDARNPNVATITQASPLPLPVHQKVQSKSGQLHQTLNSYCNNVLFSNHLSFNEQTNTAKEPN